MPARAILERRYPLPEGRTVDEDFEDVTLGDSSATQPRKKGFLSRWGNEGSANENATGTSGTHHGFTSHFTGRKRAQSGQGAELGKVERPQTPKQAAKLAAKQAPAAAPATALIPSAEAPAAPKQSSSSTPIDATVTAHKSVSKQAPADTPTPVSKQAPTPAPTPASKQTPAVAPAATSTAASTKSPAVVPPTAQMTEVSLD
jgi:hypothetical protein